MEKIMPENLYAKRNKMEKERRELQELNSRKRRNITLCGVLFLLLVISTINMASANFYIISTKGLKGVMLHIVYILLGIFCFLVGASIPYEKYNKNRVSGIFTILIIASFIFIIIGAKVIPSIVPQINGAIGWIRIAGISLQPAELMKLPYIVILAHLFNEAEKEKMKSLQIFITTFILVFAFLVLIYFQRDLGTAIHYLGIYLFVLFMSNFSMKTIVGGAIFSILGAGGFFYYINSLGDVSDRGYKIRRVASFLNGIINNEYDNSIGYQVGQSLIAFGSGGILGKGYANGVQKYSYLPEIKTDFILASFGEEFGFLGMIALLIFFLLIFNIIKRTAMSARDYFGKYLAIGIGGYIIIQVLINIYVALGMLPVFGIPMPLFSYGGTSIITVMGALGIILNINKRGGR